MSRKPASSGARKPAQTRSRAATVKPAAKPSEPEQGIFSRDGLYSWARGAWDRADWPALAALAERPLDQDPRRERLALLVAAGLIQQGGLDSARRLLDQAVAWGATGRMISELLVSGTYNSLGRAALALEADLPPDRYFESALGAFGADARLGDNARQRQAREAAWLSRQTAAPAQAAETEVNGEMLARFRAEMAGWRADRDLPLLVETKSLPRSGLHFLKSCFETALGKRFSFCEWYHEPGCCRRFPCTYGLPGGKAGASGRLRMVKSHDFDLTDPAYDPPPGVMRLILLRDPLMVLTSWWALEEIARHQRVLAAEGVQLKKVFYLHESFVLDTVYNVMERNFLPLSPGQLENWLAQKRTYVTGFLRKWQGQAGGQVHVLPYEHLPQFIGDFFAPHLEGTEEAALLRGKLEEFKPRAAPFSAKVRQIADTLHLHETAFRETSAAICRESGLDLS